MNMDILAKWGHMVQDFSRLKLLAVALLLALAASLQYLPAFTNAQPSEAEIHQQKVEKIKEQLPEQKGYIVIFGEEEESPGYASTAGGIELVHSSMIASLQDSIGRRPEVLAEFKVVRGIALDISQEEAGRLESLPGVRGVYPNYARKISLLDSVPQIRADKAWRLVDAGGRNLTGKGVKIAFLDTGVDYSHPDLSPCSPKEHILNGNVQPFILESPHPYPNDFNATYNVSLPGFASIALHFASLSTEHSFDIVEVRDPAGALVASYTGKMTDFWTPSASGDTLLVTLISDSSVTDYGFYMDQVINGTAFTRFNWANCTKIKGGFDFANSDKDPFDESGHGTHVASIAAGNGSLFKGVAPDAEIYAIQVCDDFGFCFDSDIFMGLDMAADLNNNGIPFEDRSDFADIISISFGGFGDPDDILSATIDDLVDMGIVAVISAGNLGPFGIESPGTSRNAITAGAIDKQNAVADFSSQGPVIWGGSKIIIKPDVVAPAVEICAAKSSAASFPVEFMCVDGSHVALSGTSFAAPHVSGIAALLKQKHPDWNALQIKNAIKNTAIDLGDDIFLQGHGKADALGAAQLAQSLPLPDFVISPQSAISSQSVSFNAFRSIDFDGKIKKYEWDFDNDRVIDRKGASATKSFGEGLHLVSLLATDDAGATGVETKAIIVSNDIPVADFVFSPQAPSSTQKVMLDGARSYDPDGAILKYVWDLDSDGFFETSGKKKTVKLSAGFHIISLMVTDNAGETDITRRVIIVGP